MVFLAILVATILVIFWFAWRQMLLERHRSAISQKNAELLDTLAERGNEIARRTEIEAQLRLAIEAAQQANRTKSHFLANMSHELRTPLNAVIGFSELMMGGGMPPEKAQEYAANIAEGGHHLLSVVNEILDMARIEAGKLRLSESPVDLNQLVKSTLQVLGCDKRQDKAVRFISAAPQAVVLADEVRLRQILINLLSNALKFTADDGQLVVRIEQEGGGIDLIVRDNGPGIPRDKLELILEPFGQAENTYTRAHGGVGLGLPIVKSLVELHGGRFTVISELGAGTTARVHLPASRILEPVQPFTAAAAS